MTKEQVLNRRMSEIGTPFSGIPDTPDYLSDEQAEQFEYYAGLLNEAGLISELDADSLARYVIAADNYYKYQQAAANETDFKRREQYSNMANKAFNQAHAAGAAMCLLPSARAHLIKAAAGEGEL